MNEWISVKEYIDKAELYKEIAKLEELARKRYLDTPNNSPAYPRYIAQMDERTALKHLIADFPTIDPESLRERGQWIMQQDTRFDAYYTCSNCNEDFYMECGSPADNEYKYCPNCGAKMDLEVQE